MFIGKRRPSLNPELYAFCERVEDALLYYDERRRLHRTDGPAAEYLNGDREWFIHGYKHRDGAPAVTWESGYEAWYVRGVRHRADGPAQTYPNGDRKWYVHGVLHRTDGPAVENANGLCEWWLNGHLQNVGHTNSTDVCVVRQEVQ